MDTPEIINLARSIIRTVDIAVIIGRQILMIKRAKPPFEDLFVLPGGHVEITDKTLAHAAARELKEETGIDVGPQRLCQLMTLDGRDRDPRPGRHISTVFTHRLMEMEEVANCKPATDAKSIHFLDIDSLRAEQVGFDHFNVIIRLYHHR